MFRTMFRDGHQHQNAWRQKRQMINSKSPHRRPHTSFSLFEAEEELLMREENLENMQICVKKPETELEKNTECFKFVCLSREVAEHGMREFRLSEREEPPVVIIKMFGEVHALQANCPNCDARLAQGCLSQQQRLLCPMHGSAFDIRTGALVAGVGFLSMWVYECRSLGGNVFVKCPLAAHRRRFELPVMRVCPRRYDYLGIGNRPICIVGAGIAAISCALTLREKGYSGRLVLICREHQPPYDRKSLSKRLCTEDDSTMASTDKHFSLFPGDDQANINIYDQLSLELLLGVNVREVLPQERTLTLEGHSRHSSIGFAFLVLAMGATPRQLAINAPEVQSQVLYVRTMDDAKRLTAETAGKSVAIIGSGMLGVELATTLRATAKSVTLFGKLASSLAIFGDNVRAEILDWLHENGIVVQRNSNVTHFERFGNRVQICFNEIGKGVGLCAIADKLVGAIGIMPCTSNLMRANIRMDVKGFVLVDERMRTNQPVVLACGDCTSFPLAASNGSGGGGGRTSWPHWQMAQHQGKLAAQTILGIFSPTTTANEKSHQHHQNHHHHQNPPPAASVNNSNIGCGGAVPAFVWLDLPADRHLTFAGWPRQPVDERIQFGSVRTNTFVAYHLRNGQVVSVASCAPTNLALQFMDIFRKDVRINKEQVLRNKEHNWTNYSANT